MIDQHDFESTIFRRLHTRGTARLSLWITENVVVSDWGRPIDICNLVTDLDSTDDATS
jgi:hypothetical protein